MDNLVDNPNHQLKKKKNITNNYYTYQVLSCMYTDCFTESVRLQILISSDLMFDL